MADYLIYRTDGSGPLTVPENGTLPIGGVNLIGKARVNYGITIATNVLHMIENFASATSPTSPQTGQLWYDSSAGQLKLNKGSSGTPNWVTASGAAASATQPTGASAGDLWFDTANKILYVYDGTAFEQIGDETFSSSTAPANPAIGDLWFDTGNGQLKAWNGTTWLTIGPGGTFASDILFDPGARLQLDDGTVTLPGLTFVGDTDTGIYSEGANIINFTVGGSEVLQLDSNGASLTSGVLFLPNGSNTNPSQTFTSDPDTGVFLSANGQFSIAASGVESFRVSNSEINALQNLKLTNGTVSAPSLSFTSDPNTGIYGDGNDSLFITANGQARLTANATGGQLSGAWTLDSGASLNATYADLAERYEADEVYKPGTLVSLTGNKEISITKEELDYEVFGVISTAPAFKLNAGAGDDNTHPYVALQGRVPVLIDGPISKGQRIVSSGINGTARGVSIDDLENTDPFTLMLSIIGRALEDKNTNGVSLVEAAIGVK